MVTPFVSSGHTTPDAGSRGRTRDERKFSISVVLPTPAWIRRRDNFNDEKRESRMGRKRGERTSVIRVKESFPHQLHPKRPDVPNA